MNNYKYKVSVIVPVYNIADYLRPCLDSLLDQTIDHELMEVLLINDGSTDNSLDICYEYAQSHFIFKVFSKENEGLSATRNYGLQKAQGKYLIYLDSDDKFSPETIKNVTDFFDIHYDEIDSVTFPIVKYDSQWNRLDWKHYRYNYMKNTGVYDLEEFPFCTQTNINICTKNTNGAVSFSTKPSFRHEDLKYNNDIVERTMKIGFCQEAEYMYLQRSTSITKVLFNPIELWESTLEYYENMFSKYTVVPKYYQVMLLNDMSWKIKENIFWPYHYDKEQFDKAKNRFVKLLRRVDNDLIMKYPWADNFQKMYYIRLKEEGTVTMISESDMIGLYDRCELLYKRGDFEIILKRVTINDNTLKIVGYFKSVFFSYSDDFKIIARVNDREEELPFIDSSASYYKSRDKTEKFISLNYTVEIEERSELSFVVLMDGYEYKTCFWNTDSVIFYKSFTDNYSAGNLNIKQNKNSFTVEPVSDPAASYKRISVKCPAEIRTVREKAMAFEKKKIWLYYDNYTVDYDNGYYQFKNDIGHNDGIERYYVVTNDYDLNKLFTAEEQPHLVRFGSEKHRILYLNAERIFTSFIERESLIPFKMSEFYYIADMCNAQLVYLQHGILHAHLPWYYTPVGVPCDKVIVSSQFEIDNFSANYGWYKTDIIPTGMPRYDHIIRQEMPAKKKVVFAPSWRSYLIGDIEEGNKKRTSFEKVLLNSNYYKNIMSFANNAKLKQYLEDNDIYLELKLHPNFYTTYKELVSFESDRVSIAKNKIDLNEYSMFITDFSSYVFDYAYLSRPIFYFVPDYLEFASGMNRYRKLDLPFEKAFGNMVTTPEAAVEEFIRIAENNFVPDKLFKERMDNFYLPMENCCEKLYQIMSK